MAFILHVKAECADEEIRAKLVASLTTMASLQDTHPGVICYHFTRPDPKTRPLYMEFTELYANEGAFFGHSSDMKFIEAYGNVWPTDKIKSSTYKYGTVSEKVKTILDNFLKCKYPEDTAGLIIARDAIDRQTTIPDDGPILLFGQFQAKDGKAKEILEAATNLSSEANNGVVVCFANIPEKDSSPNTIDFMELCTNNSHLLQHFTSDKSKTFLKSMVENSTEVTLRGYGKLLPDTARTVADNTGVSIIPRATDVGYVLHPNADPKGN